MIGNGKRLRIRLASGEVREIAASDSMPEGAELLAVHVPIFSKDAALRDSDSSSSNEDDEKRERERLLGEREGAYLAMKEEYSNAWKSDEERAASSKKIANPTRADVEQSRREMAESIANAWKAPLTIRHIGKPW